MMVTSSEFDGGYLADRRRAVGAQARKRLCKPGDLDGMYVAVLPSGTLSFRYSHRLDGRGETLAISRYDASLARKAVREPAALEYGMDVLLICRES
jgi:hypothetical protein